MKLTKDQRACFRLDSGRAIMGVVVAIMNNVYHVLGDCGQVSVTYSDGLFRFTDMNVVKNEDQFS